MIQKIWGYREVAFLKVEGSLSCAIDCDENLNFILCFPEVLQMLRSASPDTGLSILFHELGHLYFQHSKRQIRPLDAQFQADEFAMLHGYGPELLSVIEDYRHLEDNRKRMANLETQMKSQTMKYFKI